MNDPKHTHQFSLAVTDAASLPTVLTGIALRVPYFTVRNERQGPLRAWVIELPPMRQEEIAFLFEVIPDNLAEVHQIH